MNSIFSILKQIHGSGYKISFRALTLIAVLFILQPAAHAQTGKTDSGITIHQVVYFKVSPRQVYEAILSSKEFSESTKLSFPNFSPASAKIDSTVGGTLSVFDGHIIGRNLELVSDQRIVQAWRVVDWPPGVYSIARFEIKAQGSGTQLIFDHIGFPAGLKEHLATGWQEHYWDALTKYFQ